MAHMTIDHPWRPNGQEVNRKWTGSGPEVGQKWTGCVHLSVCMSVHPKHFPYLLDEPYVSNLQAQGACALRFFFSLFSKNKMQILCCFTFCISLFGKTFFTFFGRKVAFCFKHEIISFCPTLPPPFLFFFKFPICNPCTKAILLYEPCLHDLPEKSQTKNKKHKIYPGVLAIANEIAGFFV